MAGSRSHVTASDGSFTFDLIDHLGDAYEACEELFILTNRYEKALRSIENRPDFTRPGTFRRIAREALEDSQKESSTNG